MKILLFLLLLILVTLANCNPIFSECYKQGNKTECVHHQDICAWCLTDKKCVDYFPCENGTDPSCSAFIPSRITCDDIHKRSDQVSISLATCILSFSFLIVCLIKFGKQKAKFFAPITILLEVFLLYLFMHFNEASNRLIGIICFYFSIITLFTVSGIFILIIIVMGLCKFSHWIIEIIAIYNLPPPPPRAPPPVLSVKNYQIIR